MDKREKNARSDEYQYKMKEICMDDSILHLAPYINNNPILKELRCELLDILVELVKNNLSELEYNIFVDYYFNCMTQQDIAKKYDDEIIKIKRKKERKRNNGNQSKTSIILSVL